MEKIILDCDPGHDDAIAILLAAGNPNIDLLGITTVSGNHNVENTTRNALSVCTAYGIKVPVAKSRPADHRLGAGRRDPRRDRARWPGAAARLVRARQAPCRRLHHRDGHGA
ncbi:nucleoside hydrolase [Mesorhizobium sp. M00.F.Ca.ET.217.01.1.1]|uniref:nucleoside hydrolase n=1 Tax=Mesorhizobium sp. M00.F.Ca.ET.217.01.1.1 TaxID=2500529 RepID=UPI0034D27AA2